MREIIFLNGKLFALGQAKISILEPGFLYGWGLFETMRSLNGRIVYFDEHLARIKNSAKVIQIKFPYTVDKLKNIIRQTIKINGFRDSYVKLILSKTKNGTNTVVIVKRYKPYPAKKYQLGFSACVSKLRQNEYSILSNIKSTNYLLFRLANLEARQRGFDEAIIQNSRGYIAEASRSNIFLVKDSELFTPDLKCGCLDGITRKVIFDLAKIYNLKLYTGNFTLQDLYRADEAFLTNSLMGIMPLVSIEKNLIAKGRRGRITCFLMAKYRLLLK